MVQTTDANDITTTPAGQRQLNIGLPTLAVIESLHAALSPALRVDHLARTRAYVVGERQWLPAFATLADLSSITTRYEPSGRQWAMRKLAETLGVGVTELYRTKLQVGANDTWELHA